MTAVGDPHVTLKVQFWHRRKGVEQPDVLSAYVRRVKTRFGRVGVDFSPSAGQHLTGALALRTADGEE